MPLLRNLDEDEIRSLIHKVRNEAREYRGDY